MPRTHLRSSARALCVCSLSVVMSVLVLPSYPAGYSGEASSVVGAAAAPQSRKVEPVGRAFQSTKHAAPKPRSQEADDADAAAAAAALSPSATGLRDAKYDRYKKFDVSCSAATEERARTAWRVLLNSALCVSVV